MTFQKPDDITYTQMCIYIDSTVYTDEVDYEKVYIYCYLIAHMLARKYNFFSRYKYYDDFALFCASYMFERYNNSELDKVKSILNYLKKSLYLMKITFENSEYAQTYSVADKNTHISDYNFERVIESSLTTTYDVELELLYSQVKNVVAYYIKDIPYVTDKVLWNNIYISIMLSILSRVTPTQRAIKLGLHTEYLYDTNACDVILYHLPDNMYNYIAVLTNKIMKFLKQDFIEALYQKETYNNSEDIIKEYIECFEVPDECKNRNTSLDGEGYI